MKTLFLGSGPFGLPTLDRLATRGGDLVVGTVPDAPRGRKRRLEPTVIKARALELGLPVHEIASLKGRRGPEFLAEVPADLVITCDFRLILGRKFLAAPPLGCFNLHGSILPAWRGAAPVARGVLAGDATFGVSLYRMVYALDAGPVVGTIEHTPDEPPETDTLEDLLSRRAADLLEEWFPVLASGDVPLAEQDDTMATFAPKLEKDEGWIDWRLDASAIERCVRGLKPWPRAFTEWGSDDGSTPPVRIFLDRTSCEASDASTSTSTLTAHEESLEPGSVRAIDDRGIHVACGDGTDTVTILELQRAGKRSLPAAEFVRGFPCRDGRFLAPPPRTEEDR